MGAGEITETPSALTIIHHHIGRGLVTIVVLPLERRFVRDRSSAPAPRSRA